MTPGKGLTGHQENEHDAFPDFVNIWLLSSVFNTGAAGNVTPRHRGSAEPRVVPVWQSNFDMSPPAPALVPELCPASGGGPFYDPGTAARTVLSEALRQDYRGIPYMIAV